ncbi:MAG: BrnT family toxin [Bryobacteraceae bacterium]
MAVFDWDRNNLRKIKAHRIKQAEVEQALTKDPIQVYEQDADAEVRYIYYGETERNRMIAVVLSERGNKIRVITAYDLDAGQKREYLERRAQGE